MYDATKWTHLHREDMCSMVPNGATISELLADETDRWVLADDYADLREQFGEAEKEMEAVGDELAEWKARALAAELELEHVRDALAAARDRTVDVMRDLRAELEARYG